MPIIENINEKEAVEKLLLQYPHNPCGYIKEVLEAPIWQKQEEIVNTIWEHQRLAIRSCHGAGKSFIAARIALAFLYNHPGSIVITTAPTGNQVYNILWREIRSAWGKSKIPLGGEIMKTRLDIDPDWYAMGFSTDDPNNAQGWHSTTGWVLIIVDEAAGVSVPILRAMEGSLTSKHVRLLYIGNPTVSYGRFYDAFQSQLWKKIKISVFDTPNFTFNGINTIEDLMSMTEEDINNCILPYPMLVTPRWAYDKIKEDGADHPDVQSRVLAEFPKQSQKALINVEWIHNALGRKDDAIPLRGCIGIDTARYGDDMTVLTPTWKTHNGFRQEVGIAFAGQDTMETVGSAIELFDRMGMRKERDCFCVDDVGVGGGVTDRLREQGYTVIQQIGSSASTDDKYVNNRTEIYYLLKDLMKNNELSMDEFGPIVQQLAVQEYKHMSNGKLALVSKDEIKKKLGEDGTTGNSPDYADSLALALWGCVQYGREYYESTNKEETKQTIVGNIRNKSF